MFVGARLVLPWSNLLPAKLPHACVDVSKQRGHLADESGFFKFKRLNLAWPVSTSTGLQCRNAKAVVAPPAGPHSIQCSRSAPDPSHCGLDKPQTETKLC